MPADLRRVKDLFVAAAELSDPDARRSLLDRECAGDPDLRRRLDQLLLAHDDPASALERPLAAPAAPATVDHVPAEEPGTRVGPYKLLQVIGAGGMGTVFMAEQEEPVRRKVAVKIIKPGMDSGHVVARFEAERQALSMMDHPNIARVFDAGTTASGRPYFVMELVHGVPITEFCDARKLTPRERLDLFVPVCQAIQHAHQKGVIHRDVKPSNVLVTMYDDRPVPKVIDFGLAKAVEQRLTEKTLFTQFGTLVGTFEYMSPEQAEMNALGVDTRSDVYSLGVLLYELLTGSTPLERQRLRAAALGEVVRLIREEEPPRPSVRLTTSGALAKVADARKTEPARLPALVRGELDWIVMRCLEKDRARRYESPNALARDVQRHLAGDPVEACPPTLGYRLRKAYRRNRAAVVTTTVVVVAALAAAAGQTWNVLGARAAEAEAVRQRDEAETARAEVSEERRKVRDLLTESERNRRAADLRAASAVVDLDLKVVTDDTTIGLLRLARTLRTLPPDARELRQFVAMAMIAHGQELAPLLPPFEAGVEEEIWSPRITPDGRAMLTWGDEGSSPSRVWDARTGRLLAVLREGAEESEAAELSHDGRVVYTVAADGVVRFWDVPSGRLQARTDPLDPAYGQPQRDDKKRLGNEFFLSQDGRRFASVVLVGKGGEAWDVAVWDAATGRGLARLPRFDRGKDRVHVAFSPDARLFVTARADEPIRVWSADDGALRHALPPGQLKGPQAVAFSPSGRRVAVTDGHLVLFWETAGWRSNGWSLVPVRNTDTSPPFVNGMTGLTDHVFELSIHRPGTVGTGSTAGPGGTGWVLAVPAGRRGTAWADDDVVVIDTDVIDRRDYRSLHPPAGQLYHPALARFAVDGRWLPNLKGVEDLAVGKEIALNWQHRPVHVPGVGFVGTREAYFLSSDDEEMWQYSAVWIPTPARLPPDDLLVLWAGVVARGELSPVGEFVKWDEPTWEKKRQELAARPSPFADFPFPGRPATDRLHWLRAEYCSSRSVENARAMVRRAEEIGDVAEAAYWRVIVTKLTKKATPPREVKP